MDSRQQGRIISPSTFMRQLRPEIYSDSSSRASYQLKMEVLSHHLDTITDRNQTHDFELFCRKLCERTICPNLRPATGPEGGGDSKADTETVPVSDEIYKLAYVGLSEAGKERWAFAFSAKRTWSTKARSDVAGIIATNRGYTRIFFITSRSARAKDRSRLEDELSSMYGIQVTIYDRSWILDEIIDKNRQDLAFNYLGVGDATAELELGPSDYSRKQQLADIERELLDPASFAGLPIQRASEALIAAKLARALDLPRVEVDGRLLRAIRLSDDGGTRRQQLNSRYEALWTAFWWYDDVNSVINGYESFEEMVIESSQASSLEMLCNLLQLLFNAVIHLNVDFERIKLKSRIDRLSKRLEELTRRPDQPNNALEAKTSLLTIRVNEAILAGDPDQLRALWPQFSLVLTSAQGLAEFDATRLVRLIQVFGQIAGKDRGYRDLVDQVSDFVAKRSSEGQGALVLLQRADQLDLHDNMEMIRILGRAAKLLSKKEYRSDLIHAQAKLSIAYRSAGLLWAARASSTSAVTSLFIEAEEGDPLPSSVFPLLMNLAWQSVELKNFPEILDVIRVARGSLNSLPFDETSQERARDQLWHFDMVLACQIANLSPKPVRQLRDMPDILHGLGLHHSRITLLYLLGYEDLLRTEGSIPDSESEEDVIEFFSQLAGQPAGDDTWRPGILNDGKPEVFVTSVLGVLVRVIHQTSDTSIALAEAITGSIEAFFATAFELNAFGHVESFDIEVIESSVKHFKVTVDSDRLQATVHWPNESFPGSTDGYPELVAILLELSAQTLLTTCRAPDIRHAVSRLCRSDAALERTSMIASACVARQRVLGRVSRLSTWDEYLPTRYTARTARPVINRTRPAAKDGHAAPGVTGAREALSSITDHRDAKVYSVINVRLWDQAGWAGTAYGVLDSREIPFLALTFRDHKAAEAIFHHWHDRFGDEDKEEDIYIGIIRELPSQPPSHYGMIVTSRIPEDLSDVKITTTVSRSLTMQPADDINLETFLQHFARAGEYLLLGMIIEPGQSPRIIPRSGILKRALHVKQATEVAQHEPEGVFLSLRDPI